jgi:hypothetical protein
MEAIYLIFIVSSEHLSGVTEKASEGRFEKYIDNFRLLTILSSAKSLGHK